jgi:RNA polymerase sigma factor (sigma-70 family)
MRLEPMPPLPGPCSVEELLAQSSWLRRLAATLVAGEDAAEDLVQETWLAALRHPPRSGGSPRPWLARIARNLASNFRRGEARRAEREARAPERGPELGHELDPGAVVEEVEAQRVLAEAVLRLEEPLRTAVVLRHVRGLDSREIGRLQGIPAATVRGRLKRGLECLRADLDRRFGERRAWCVALAGLARHATGAGPTAGALAGASVKLAAAGTLAAAGVIALGAWWIAGRSEPRPVTSAKELAAVEAARDLEEEGLELATPDRVDAPARSPRSVRDEPDTASSTAARPGSRRGPIHGQLRIADTEKPLDEVLTIRLRAADLSAKETVQSAPDGSFRSQRSFPRGFVLGEVLRPAGDPAGDVEAYFDPSSGEGFVLDVPWPNFVRGRLVGRSGEELEDVEVHVEQGGTEKPLDRHGASFDGQDLGVGTCTVTVRRGFERHELSTVVRRGPNELGDVLVPFRERVGPIRGRLRSVYGEPQGQLVLTDLASGVTYEAGAGGDSKEVSEFEFEPVPRGDYRLTLFSHDGQRYADRTRYLRPPATDIEFVAIGENEPLVIRAFDGESELFANAWVLSSGRWFGPDHPPRDARDVERWILVSKDRRPASGRAPESTRVEVALEPGWGFALFLREGSGGDYPEEKGPIAGIEVLADGLPVARSDADGLALVSLPHEPGKLECVLDGWVVLESDVEVDAEGEVPIGGPSALVVLMRE